MRLAALLLAGCWASAPPPAAVQQPAQEAPKLVEDPEEPPPASYDLPFERVYHTTLETIRATYPNLDDDPARRTIKTAWHQLKGNPAHKRYFGRLDVQIDGPPWAIEIVGRVAEWKVGDAVPTELGEADRVRLDREIASLRRAIHAQLARQ
jgi:hypothetical protein